MKLHYCLLPGLLFALPVYASPVVVKIADGDTLTILDQRQQIKVRLANIDAPERKQAFGTRSQQSLAALCFRKTVTVQVQTIDRYGRTVAVVTCDGVEANRAQVERGMAWVYTRYNKDPALHALQSSARESKRGLWVDPEPIPPWEFRKLPKQ